MITTDLLTEVRRKSLSKSKILSLLQEANQGKRSTRPPFLEGLKYISCVRVEAELYLSCPSISSPPKEFTSSSLS
ncbi:hypothetical protein PIB30_095371 [Stylosanthes scabra]|uniref:Uncharacterized protein n=1 Tax=Stylosanthes scabra TaxID=79078 RepID=A0ABU6QWB9_9FABA|nr:hypothetical protein [Stylosanthes scabra]